MKYGIFATLGLIFLTGCASTTPTRTTEQAYMIIDVKGDSSIRNKVLDTVISTAQESMDRLAVNRGIPPSNLPETASRFELVSPFANSPLGGMVNGFSAISQASGGSSMKIPSCKDPILTMKSNNSDAGFSENTTFFICVVQYKQGYHVDVYTTFEQQSGGLSVNALSASLARSIVGDTSQIIPRTMKRLETALAAVSPETKVVDSYIPEKWKGLFLDEVSSVSKSN